MNKQEKNQIIKDLSEKFSDSNYFYIINAMGLTVAEVNDLRKECHQKGIKYQVVKNTLIQKALDTLDNKEVYESFSEQVLKGFSGILFTTEDKGSIPAQIIKKYRKDTGGEIPVLKGASIDGEVFIGDQYLDELSKLKSKEELIGEVITLLQSPMKQVLASLQSGEHKLAGMLKGLADKKEG